MYTCAAEPKKKKKRKKKEKRKRKQRHSTLLGRREAQMDPRMVNTCAHRQARERG